MKKAIIIGIWTIMILSFAAFASASLSCEVATTCSTGYEDILHMSALSNAHAELADGTDYDYKICCEDNGTQNITITTTVH